MTLSRTGLTYDDYVAIPEDGFRHEIIDGREFVNAAPNLYHQAVSRRLQFQLYEQVELRGLGQVMNAPVDLQLSEHDVVQPDLVVVLKQNEGVLIPSRIRGVPDLVVEILSPSTSAIDRGAKKDLYGRSGVPEYWIVDPDSHQVRQYVLETKLYLELAVAETSVKYRGLESVSVDLTRVW